MRSYATTPPECPRDGFWRTTVELTWSDGSFDSLVTTQPCRADRTLTLDANKNKVKKGKKVTLSGQVTEFAKQGECVASQPVLLQRKKPSQASFATVEQLQTTATGSFTTKEKVKKTFQYRAQVAESAGCDGQVSNTEKVKVKKKK